MVNPRKQELVQKLAVDIQKAPVVGLVNMQNLPAAQLQRMRALLAKQGVTITMTRKKLLHRALDGSQKQQIMPLAEKMKGMPALLLTGSNPFALAKTIQKNKSEAPARSGQLSPRDIVVKAGPTNFAPGPIISELAAVGIKTKVEQGKLSIISDTTIVKEGQAISQKVSETLKRLDIKPMEIGLDLVAVWESGLVFEARQLQINEVEYADNISQAAQGAMNLAIEAAYPTAETTEILLQKAFQEAKTVSLELNIITDLTAGDILAKVEREALALIQEANLEIPEKPVPEAAQELTLSSGRAEEKNESAEQKKDQEKTEEKIKEHREQKQLSSHSLHPTPAHSHPKQGTVTQDEAANLLAALQKKGTLR